MHRRVLRLVSCPAIGLKMEVLYTHVHTVSKYVYYYNGLFPISVYTHVRGHVESQIRGPRTYTYNRVQEVRGEAKCTPQATVTPSGGNSGSGQWQVTPNSGLC
jgi:hypothetical protein